jgi:hypothetical protein
LFQRIVLGYIGIMSLDKQVQIRMPKDMHELLLLKAKERGPGAKVTDLIREAIHQVYFASKESEKKARKKGS